MIGICLEQKITIITVLDGKTFGEGYDKDALLYGFTICSDITKQNISNRTKAGLDKVVRFSLGRRAGSKNSKGLFFERNFPIIKELLLQGYSCSKIAKKLKVHRNTIYRGVKRLQKKGKL